MAGGRRALTGGALAGGLGAAGGFAQRQIRGRASGEEEEPEEQEVTASIKTGEALPIEAYYSAMEKLNAAACDTPGEKKRSGGMGRGEARGGGKGPMGLPAGFAANQQKVEAAQDPSKPGAEKPDLSKEAFSPTPLQAGIGAGLAGLGIGAGGLALGQRIGRERQEAQIEQALQQLPGALGEFYSGNPERRDEVADFMSRMPEPSRAPLGTQATTSFAPISDEMLDYIEELKKTKAAGVPEKYASAMVNSDWVGAVPEAYRRWL